MLPEKYNRTEIGRRIKQARTSQSLTLQQLATRAEMSPGYLSEVERGMSTASYEKLLEIIEALGVPKDTVLEDAPQSPATDVVQIPAALSEAAARLNLSHRDTLTLLQGRDSLRARRSQSGGREWTVDEWIRFYEQVKEIINE